MPIQATFYIYIALIKEVYSVIGRSKMLVDKCEFFMIRQISEEISFIIYYNK